MAKIEAVLVDSNVLLDVVSASSPWSNWSSQRLTEAATSGRVIINPIIYAEVSVRYSQKALADAAMPPDRFIRESIPYKAAFLAGKAFTLYRGRGGTRTLPLPDLFIGAHAVVAGYRLLTRDASRYRTYFPRLTLIAP